MKNRFSYPGWLREHQFPYDNPDELGEAFFKQLRGKLSKFRSEKPDVSIMIPAWNEEKNLLRTLSSFAAMETPLPAELVVMNNNSTDRTAEVLERLGIQTIFVERQGISYTRQAGLEAARGTYHLCADADSIYPPGWCRALTTALQNPAVTVAHGRHSFIPPEGSGRVILGSYELLAETLFDIRRKNREYLNVLGFNFGFRTADGRAVGGFNTNRPRWSDGWMAMTLMERGKIELVAGDDARVWTSARRLIADGSLGKAFTRRVKKELRVVKEYFVKTEVKKN